MAKTLAQIQAKHEHKSKDKDGKIVTSQKFIKNFTFFEDIEYLYSTLCPEGIKIDGWHVALYCRFLSYQANGNNCYESHDTLARKCKASSSTVQRRIKELKKLGLVKTDKHPNPNISSLLYTALPLTDAHIIPPDQLSAAPESDVVRQQPEPMPAPEPATAEELNAPDLDAIPFACDEPEEQPTPTIPTQQDKPELPWGGTVPGKTNGQPQDAAMEWALTKTKGDEEEAYRLISRVASEYLGKEVVFEPQAEDDFDDIEF
ncbi:helix-turn-helix domain-containing protein [Buttiauxella ferragutiae]|uniref:helix-turn-helix domain-containing protein n=1 Tax=Buttiauxella ferragutiae TaxID=82989 RepID=UPI001F532561|nr:helix-turn-helix domain-containing protein [Buttiauxella ferragutiae]UNK60859.1 helix-turn-helix domain-containing protein [Buttiauxella ferragutiae]